MRLAGLVMAAGLSARMGGPNKLLAKINGKPLVRIAVEAANVAGLDPVIAITGRDAPDVERALASLPAVVAHNRDFAFGFSSSLRVAFSSLPDELGGAFVLLGDMPMVTATDLGVMAEAFAQRQGRCVVRAADGDRPGNPVLIPSSLFAGFRALGDDETGRDAILRSGLATVLVDIGRAALADADTPERLAALGAVWPHG